MSVLLRRPAIVPTLFSRAVEWDLPAPPPVPAWRRAVGNVPLLAISGWTIAMLIDVPLVKAATALAGLGAPG